jgi:exopolysaccharide biosynthesis polyprenyl glycosylphosphotransferase
VNPPGVNLGVDQPVSGTAAHSRQNRFFKVSRPVADPAAPRLHRDSPIAVRLSLQSRANENVRRHLIRTIQRTVVLGFADLGAFLALRTALRAVRDHAVLGQPFAQIVAGILPRGIFGGYQFAVGLIISLVLTKNYGHGDERRDARRIFAACTLAPALAMWTVMWQEGLAAGAVQYSLTTLLLFSAVLLDRWVVDWMVDINLPQGSRNLSLLVGPAAECKRVMADAALLPATEYYPLGFVDVAPAAHPDAIGSVGDFARALQATDAETVVICGYLADHDFQEVIDIAIAAGCRVLSVPRAIDLAAVQPVVRMQSGRALIELRVPSLSGQQVVAKRLLDLLGAAVGILASAPLLILIALAIKLDSRGPVFFTQERIGTAGRRFRVFKFRTMFNGVSDKAHRDYVTQLIQGDDKAAAHVAQDGQAVFKLVGDRRVTRLGRLLRHTSLDELPQLLNVLIGDMSLVGPRPPLGYEFEAYDHWQFDRLRVRPGITGLWQVSGRNRLSYRQMCELDLDYIRGWSLWLDLKILLKTVPVVAFNLGRAA